MKKRINLLTKHEKYIKVEKTFAKIRMVTVAITCVFFLTNALFVLLLINQQQEIKKLNSKKEVLLKFLIENANLEAKYKIFSLKYESLKDILNQDVNFYPYYSIINESLKSATTEALLKSIKIEKDKTTNFSVSFATFSAMINFLTNVENQDFNKNFKSLSLKSFSLTQDKNINKNEYLLNFEGKFKDL
jgi:hypothetical protein